MRDALIAILLCGVAVAACEVNPSVPAEIKTTVEVSSDAAADFESSTSGSGMQFRADTESGEMQLKLPGGIEGKFKLPEGMGNDAKFDLDGVGRYPGAKLTGVNVVAPGGDVAATVELGFTAPGSADTVADWYEKAFAREGRSVLRTATTLSTSTEDGEQLVMVLRDGPGGTARGRITIRDEKN